MFVSVSHGLLEEPLAVGQPAVGCAGGARHHAFLLVQGLARLARTILRRRLGVPRLRRVRGLALLDRRLLAQSQCLVELLSQPLRVLLLLGLAEEHVVPAEAHDEDEKHRHHSQAGRGVGVNLQASPHSQTGRGVGRLGRVVAKQQR